MAGPTRYRRLVLDLHHDAADRRMLAAAAEFARLLGLDLHGIFVEDEGVHGLAGLPFAREFRLLTHDWTPIRAEQVAADFRQAAAGAQRLLVEVADALGVSNAFESLRGDPITGIVARIGPGDILLVAEPGHPRARIARPFARLCEAAFHAPGALLIMPPAGRRSTGSVAVAVRDPDDPSVDLAASLAAPEAAGLLLLAEASKVTEAAKARLHQLGVPPDAVRTRLVHRLEPHDLVGALAADDVRLLVLPRRLLAHDGATAARIAGASDVPVLVVEAAPA